MESVSERADRVGTQLTKFRWALGLNGLCAVAVGVIILLWPSISLFALTMLFGAWVFVSGIFGLASGFGSGASKRERSWLTIISLFNVVLGLCVLVWPSISALALLYVIGAYAVVLGIGVVAAAVYLPIDGGDAALLVLTGVVSVIFGVVIFAKPGDGALVTLALIAAFALVTGFTELAVAIGGKRMVESSLKRTFARSPRPSSV